MNSSKRKLIGLFLSKYIIIFNNVTINVTINTIILKK